MSLAAVSLFPFEQYWWVYLTFIGLVSTLLLLDLGVFHRHAHRVSAREASIWTAIWIGLALLFNVGLFYFSQWTFGQDPRLLAIPGFDATLAAKQVSLEFITGYVIEKSLAVDNIFVFLIVFSFFAIPARYQHRVLFYGIIGALFFRAIFIALGSVLMQYEWIIWIFGGFLIFTGLKILIGNDKAPDPSKNRVLKLMRRVLPVTKEFHGQKFFVRVNKMVHATPLLMGLVFLELSDIIFAIDSVPAIFAITREPLIVFTSNIFAILGLRSMFFLLADVMHRFHYLNFGLGLILIFVGLKMSILNELMGGKFPISWSLAIIASILLASILASLVSKPSEAKKQ